MSGVCEERDAGRELRCNSGAKKEAARDRIRSSRAAACIMTAIHATDASKNGGDLRTTTKAADSRSDQSPPPRFISLKQYKHRCTKWIIAALCQTGTPEKNAVPIPFAAHVLDGD
jgi:hypothetical protein